MAKRLRDVLALLAVAGLAMGLAAACAGDGDESASAQELDTLRARVQELEAQKQAAQEPAGQELDALQGRVQELEAQQQAAQEPAGPALGPTIMVKPAFFKYPASRVREPGLIWFYGSGLEPGQWFRISIEAEGEDGDVVFAPEDLRQANASGAFALTQPELRPDRWAVRDVFGQQGGVFNVKLWDMDTDTLLAWTPLVICGSQVENPWCEEEEEVVAEPGAPTVFDIARIRIEDDYFQLRIGATPYWGYEVEQRIDSAPGDGWVMTIALGDSILISERLENRGSVDHHFTIADLGIDVAMTPNQRITDGFVIKPDRVGEFVINDSLHPDAHGKALLIVTEASGAGAGAGGTVWAVEQMVMEDGRIQLRMGPQAYWGYAAGDRPYADEVGGLVMTVKVGDTITFDTIRMSGSRSTKPHHFTIEGLGIDLNLDEGTGGSRVEPYEIKLETAGEFIIDDSTDPGLHGSAKIVVEE